MSRHVHHSTFIARVRQLGRIRERVARSRPTVKGHAWNLGQHDQLGKLTALTQQQPARLSQPFKDQRGGHDRETGLMIVQMLFRQGDVFNRLGVRTTLELGEPINPEPTHETPFGTSPATIRHRDALDDKGVAQTKRLGQSRGQLDGQKVHDHVDREQVLDVLNLRIRRELVDRRGIGVRQTRPQFDQSLFGDATVLGKARIR